MKLNLRLIIFLAIIAASNTVESGDFTADSLKSIVTVIQAVKTAKDLWHAVKDLPPTLADKLYRVFSKTHTIPKTTEDEADTMTVNNQFLADDRPVPMSAYDFVVDLTRPTDIYGPLKAYPVSFPLGKGAYDNKTKGNNKKKSRFMVNVVGRYNVGKTYVLRLLANLNLGHSFVERTNGISVSLPNPINKHDPNIALIDTAGSRTPVNYDSELFSKLSYERQISDAFIQEIALNSAEIFLFVVNQLTLDDQLYLKTLRKRFQEKRIDSRDIKQRLLLVHNYFNLRTEEEVEKTVKYELGELFGAHQQHEGLWLSDDFKHFVLANSESEAGRAFNNHTVDLLLTMIKASNARQVDNVLEHVMYQIELLLKRFLEKKPNVHHEENHDSVDLTSETRIKATPDKQNEVELSKENEVDIELELKSITVTELESEPLWFICPQRPISSDITLSKNLKFNTDGSVYIDYSSKFIPDIHIAETNDYGDILISIECPLCLNSSIKVTLRGNTLLIQGEKVNKKMSREYLNTIRIGKFNIEIPLGKLDDQKTFDYQKRTIDIRDGIIKIIVPVIREPLPPSTDKGKKGWLW